MTVKGIDLGMLFPELFVQYIIEGIEIFLDADDEYYSYIPEKEVHLPRDFMNNITEWSFFAFLHEIGHIKTNTTKMKRYEQEYLATQWALDKAKELNFIVSQRTISIYQNYIWRWRETSIKLRAKKVLPKELLMISY